MLIRESRRSGGAEICAMAVMAKASSAGVTKTRLSPPLTPDQAAQLNTAFIRDIADNLMLAGERANIAPFMAFGPAHAAPFFEAQLSADIGLVEAWLPNFGDCLYRAADTLLGLHYGAVCLINSDSPTLPTTLLVEAAQALQRPGARLIVGPSTDGGYYLLGMKQAHPRLFAQIDWSTQHVLGQTLERAEELALETLILPRWYDVDDAHSLQLLARETLFGNGFSGSLASYQAPHTSALLRRQMGEGALPDFVRTTHATARVRAPPDLP